MTKDHGYAPVSVVIPCFCCISTIRRAIASVACQTVKPSEIILVDDSSTDDTWIALMELEQDYPDWIKLLRLTSNQGAASARNAGWRLATHPYIAFLDADDTWHPRKLEMQYAYMKSNSDVALCCHQSVWLREKEAIPVLPQLLAVREVTSGGLLKRNTVITSTVMLKRDIAFRFQEGRRWSEDLLLWQQIAFSGLRIVRMEGTFCYAYKPFYGVGGLSAQLWNMEQGELSNLVFLYREKQIGFLLCVASVAFSLIKFIKRLVVATVAK